MKKRILAYTLPFLLGAGGIVSAAPIALFEQDYAKIMEASLNASILSQFKERSIELQSVVQSENVADFTAELNIVLNENENFQSTEKGEIVFTNYAENKGVATIISKGNMIVNSLREGSSNSILAEIEGINTQSQIDRENKSYKFAVQYPKITLVNPDVETKGTVVIEDAVADGIYGFEGNFDRVKTIDAAYKSGKVTIDVEDASRAVEVSVANTLATVKVDNQASIQKSVMEAIEPKVISTTHDGTAYEFSLDKLTYTAGADVVDSGPRVYGDFNFKNIVIKPDGRDQNVHFGDVVLDIKLTSLTQDLFEKLETLSVNGLSSFDSTSFSEVFKVQDYFVEGSAFEFSVNGELADSTAKNSVRIVPKVALINRLAETDLEDEAAVSNLFAGLGFFDFVKQYIAEIDVDVKVKQKYIMEFGSNILLAQGEHETIESARTDMKEVYQQFMFMAMMANSETPVVEFVDEGISINIQYRDGVWTINGHVVDLESLASLFG